MLILDMLKHYLPLCWFKNHPLQLPSSVPFFQQNLIFYFLIWVTVQANMISTLEAFVEMTLETALTVLFVAVILSLNRSMHNYIQVATAVFVCENVVAIVGVPIIAWLTVTNSWLSYVFLIALILWDFALITYIMKKALAIDILASLVVSFVYFVTTYGAAYALTTLLV